MASRNLGASFKAGLDGWKADQKKLATLLQNRGGSVEHEDDPTSYLATLLKALCAEGEVQRTDKKGKTHWKYVGKGQ